MAPPRSLPAFLAAARAALTAPASQRPSPLTIVVGNESADLDSLCSAVLLAYFRSHARPQSPLTVPLANLPRADLGLRPELGAVFAGTSVIADSALPTLSDLPEDLVADSTRWLLVDHNALTGDLGRRFGGRVVGCIDHHVDEKAVPTDSNEEEPRVIETCGSCASLVTNYVRKGWTTLAKEQPDAETDRLLARVALAPILVDTSDLQSKSKTTATDREAATFLQQFLVVEATSSTSSSYYETLSTRKNDIASFSYDDVFRKDYKQWDEAGLRLGMATVVQGIDYLLAHQGDKAILLASLQIFAEKRKLDLVAVMTVQHDKTVGFARQLLLWARSEKAVTAAQRFVRDNTERLGLVSWRDGQLDHDDDEDVTQWRVCWTQQRTEFSRKQVAPYLRAAMRNEE